MKRAIAVLALALLLFCACTATAAQQTENLLENGSFEQLDSSGAPLHWYSTAYREQPGYSRLVITDEQAYSGAYSAMVENASSNDARFVYTAKVEPRSLYRLSGYVLVEEMGDTGNGANFGIEGIYAFSDCLYDTNGEWQYLEWYGETGKKQNELTLGVRVGGYSAESTGKAYFDDLTLQKVDALPTGVIASVWYDSGAASSARQSQTESTGKKTVWFVVLALFFVAAAGFVRPYGKKHLLFACMMAVGLIVRLILAIRVPGYEVDINCFKAWSMRMAVNGPSGFYAPDYFCDYPPGAMLLLWPFGALLHNVYSTSAALLTIKALPILCDLLGAVFLYCFGCRKNRSQMAGFAAGLYLLNPAVLVNGAAWGQMDSVLTLLLLFTVFMAMQRKWQWAIPMFAVSALVKPQALLFAPIGGIWLLIDLFRQPKDQLQSAIRQIFLGVCTAVAAALVIVVPFSIHQEKPLTWLFELYQATLSSYSYATLNTANLYYLIGANWTGLDQLVPVFLTIATSAFLLGCAWILWHKKSGLIGRSFKNIRLISVLLLIFGCIHLFVSVFGASYASYGYAMMALVYLYVFACMLDRHDEKHLCLYMALALIGVYVLGVKVHERYLYPALALLLLCYMQCHDKRILWLFAGFSATTFVNTAIVLENSILYGAAQGHLNADTYGLNLLLCIVNLSLLGFAGWIGLTGCHAQQAEPAVLKPVSASQTIPESYRQQVLAGSDARMHLNLRDYLLMGVTTVLYAVVAFTNLGSTVAPQTAWVSTSADEQVVLDLGQKQDFSVLYYAGVSYNNFSISVSDDGVLWSEEYPCQMREGLCWQWKYAVQSTTDENGLVSFTGDSARNKLQFSGRYLRINACEAGLNLWEVVARNTAGENIPMTVAAHTGAMPDVLENASPASNLCDEMQTCTGEPSWYNSMYFDEIYHAREAYHNLHAQTTYEWTHPPLGKLLMAAGVAIFGMTPFGWRFAGTLIGVAMLPALYLLGMQLTRKRTVAAVSMFAFALDLMHFTQTRLATIDSFPLVFILFSYVFMVRYMQMDLLPLQKDEQERCFTRAFVSSLVPLALCGLCMSLSIASKWTGCYSAVGLAILFFLSIFRQTRMSTIAYEIELKNETLTNEQKRRLHNAQRFTIKRIFITCGFCVLVFVALPLLVYYLSYIPQIAPSGPVTISRVIATQRNMLSYHATPGLGMDHPFQSPWWQWPFILKPIWYVQDAYEPAGYASTIMCLGNPWVFYIGAFAMLGVLIAFVCKYTVLSSGRVKLRQGNGDLTLMTLVIAFLAQYLPWMLVPRSMYIYHYFASVPFIILSTAWFLSLLPKQKPALRWAVIGIYLLGAAVFFVMFFPYASGVLTNTRWLDAMKWFSRLYY